jgi:glycine cleavage system H protein
MRYSAQHLWVLVVGETARIGLTDRFGGTVDAVRLPNVGESIRRGEPFGWAISEEGRRAVAAPISGTVVLVNELLDSDARTVVNDPFGAGWLIECQLSYDETLDDVMGVDEYRLLGQGRWDKV